MSSPNHQQSQSLSFISFGTGQFGDTNYQNPHNNQQQYQGTLPRITNPTPIIPPSPPLLPLMPSITGDMVQLYDVANLKILYLENHTQIDLDNLISQTKMKYENEKELLISDVCKNVITNPVWFNCLHSTNDRIIIFGPLAKKGFVMPSCLIAEMLPNVEKAEVEKILCSRNNGFYYHLNKERGKLGYRGSQETFNKKINQLKKLGLLSKKFAAPLITSVGMHGNFFRIESGDFIKLACISLPENPLLSNFFIGLILSELISVDLESVQEYTELMKTAYSQGRDIRAIKEDVDETTGNITRSLTKSLKRKKKFGTKNPFPYFTKVKRRKIERFGEDKIQMLKGFTHYWISESNESFDVTIFANNCLEYTLSVKKFNEEAGEISLPGVFLFEGKYSNVANIKASAGALSKEFSFEFKINSGCNLEPEGIQFDQQILCGELFCIVSFKKL